VTVDRTLTGLQADPAAISPNGDGVNDGTTLSFVLTQSAPVRLDIIQSGLVVGSPFQGQLAAGPNTIAWDGTGFGAPLFDGAYLAAITITDQLGQVQSIVPLSVDNTPPRLTLVDRATLRFTLDEPATVTVLVNQRTRIVLSEPKGTFRVPFDGGSVAQVEAQDAAGNFSPVVAGLSHPVTSSSRTSTSTSSSSRSWSTHPTHPRRPLHADVVPIPSTTRSSPPRGSRRPCACPPARSGA
jgi:hypothetical protein